MSDFEEDSDEWIEIEEDSDDWIEIEDDDENEQYNDELLDLAEEDVYFCDCESETIASNSEEEQYLTLRYVLSLKANCLECITQNFERFNNAYLSSKDPVLHRNLEFLQRKYSSQIIRILNVPRLLNDRYLDLLINEHLKELDIRMFVENNCSLKAIEKRIVLVGHGFTKVSFDLPPWGVRKVLALEHYISDCLNASICCLSNVEVLRILQLCNDTTLKNVSLYCTKLKELDIDGSYNVTNKGLEMLCKKQEERKTDCLIKVLSVRDTHVSESTISYLLRSMPSLEVLNHNNLPFIMHSMHKEDLTNNTLNNVKKYNLTKLDFSCASTSLRFPDSIENRLLKEEILQVFTEVCPEIKDLRINYATENCMDLISCFSNLEHLTVDGETTSFGELMDFNNFFRLNDSKLQSLQIGYFTLSVSVLIESCPKLEKLVLTDVEFQSPENLTEFQPFKEIHLKSLRELCLSEITFSDQFAEGSIYNILHNSRHLEKLYFDRCTFKKSKMNSILVKFCQNSALEYLRFYHCDITLDLLESIILTSSLLCLTISHCNNIRRDDANNLIELGFTTRCMADIVFNIFDSEEETIYSNENNVAESINNDFDDDDDDSYSSYTEW